jgi:hypothetical protein
MKSIDIHLSPKQELYKQSFSLGHLSPPTKEESVAKPIVNIQYINADELEGSYISKPKKTKPTEETPSDYVAKRAKKMKKPEALFSLSNIGIGLITIGTLDFTVKNYLAGSLLIGMGLLGYGIGKNMTNAQ